MLVGVGLEDRADRRVELRVHQHDRFAVLERLERNLRAELDRAGHVDQDVDLLRLAEEECVVCDNRPPGADGVLELSRRRRYDHVVASRIVVDLLCALEVAAVHRRHLHSRHAVNDLVREPLGHEAGADHADAHRLSLRFAGAERVVDNDHETAAPCSAGTLGSIVMRRAISCSFSDRRGKARSFSVISVTGSGQVRPRRGSSWRRPPSASGV